MVQLKKLIACHQGKDVGCESMQRYSRLIVLLILFIPLAVAAYGWKLLRESAYYFFYVLRPDGSEDYAWMVWQLIWHVAGGLALLGFGLFFLGGFLLHRQRKKSGKQDHPEKASRLNSRSSR